MMSIGEERQRICLHSRLLHCLKQFTEARGELSVNKSWLDREPHLVELQPDQFSTPAALSEQIDKNLAEIQRMVEDQVNQDTSLGETEWFSIVDGTQSMLFESQRPKLDAASLPLANLRGAELAGASASTDERPYD